MRRRQKNRSRGQLNYDRLEVRNLMASLANGEEVISSIGVGETESFDFEVDSPGTILVSVGEINFFQAEPVVTLFDSSGNQLITDSGGLGAGLVYTTQSTGTFTAVVSDQSNDDAMDFNIRVLAGSAPAQLVAGRDNSLQSGEEVATSIPHGTFGIFPIEVNSPGNVLVSAGKTNDGNGSVVVRLFDPNGLQVRTAGDSPGTGLRHDATVTGTFTAVVHELNFDQAMEFSVRALAVPDDAQLIAGRDEFLQSGEEVTRSISHGAFGVYPIEVTSPGTILVSAGEINTSSFEAVVVRLFDPNGSQVEYEEGSPGTAIRHDATLTGTYTAVVNELHFDQAMEFRLRALTVPNDAQLIAGRDEFLQSGEEATTLIPHGTFGFFPIEVTSPGTVLVSAGKTNNGSGSIVVRLFDPNGLQVKTAGDNPGTGLRHEATVIGTFTAVVHELNFAQSLELRVRALTPFSDSQLIAGRDEFLESGDEVFSSIPIGTFGVYPIEVAGPGNVLVSANETNSISDEAIVVRLFDPNGLQVEFASGSPAAEIQHEATLIGTYTAVVNELHFDQAMDFSITAIFPDDGDDQILEALSIANGAFNSLNDGDDIDMFSFNVVRPGQRLSIDTEIFGGGDTHLRIFDASGLQLASNDDFGGLDSSVTYQFATPGTYYAGVSYDGNVDYDPQTGSSSFDSSVNTATEYSITIDDANVVDAGFLRRGVAVQDDATGTGFIMYTESPVSDRFQAHPDNADHFIAVRRVGQQWQYNSNVTWIDFSPTTNDVLLAEVDFSANTVDHLAGTATIIGGIAAGYFGGDINFAPEIWGGNPNAGEFGITGSSFVRNMVSTTMETQQVPVGNVRRGVAVADDATGQGYLLHSAENVDTRFGDAYNGNADNLIAVRIVGNQWQYNNNVSWVDFSARATDRLLAELDFSNDTVNSLEGTNATINGIAAGYIGGDLAFAANFWNGGPNLGEFGVTGTFFEIIETELETVNVGATNRGIAVADDATGGGYVLYSVQNVDARFGDAYNGNADHLIAVRFNGGQWQYNNNTDWVNFTTAIGDRLLAELDFSADTVASLTGIDTTVNGVQAGYASGNLVVTPNSSNGATNNGEFGVTGNFFEFRSREIETTSIGLINRGIAVADDATGTGYILYSVENVDSRFGDTYNGNADHLIAARFNGGQWQYNNNSSWVNFTPTVSDRLIAEVDFSGDSIESIFGSGSQINGIAAGYDTGDLVFAANQWNGSSNLGEFGVSGTYFGISTSESINNTIGATNFGVAVDDAATGTGYLMFSNIDIDTRFSDAHPNNADHLIAVRLVGSSWQYNNNQNWVDFELSDSDVLLAELDFDTDTVDSFAGIDTVIGGIEAGFIGGDLDFLANSWNGDSNEGEFQIFGSFFEHETI